MNKDTPSFAITRAPGFGYPLREGIEVSLKCDVDSNPPSTPMWQKDDQEPPVSFKYFNFLINELMKKQIAQNNSKIWFTLDQLDIIRFCLLGQSDSLNNSSAT